MRQEWWRPRRVNKARITQKAMGRGQEMEAGVVKEDLTQRKERKNVEVNNGGRVACWSRSCEGYSSQLRRPSARRVFSPTPRSCEGR